MQKEFYAVGTLISGAARPNVDGANFLSQKFIGFSRETKLSASFSTKSSLTTIFNHLFEVSIK